MRIVFLAIFLFSGLIGFSQEPTEVEPKKSLIKTQEEKDKELAKKAPITSYRIITIDRDTTFVDTSLTLKDEYDYNYLRKDIFGLMPFANEGLTYTTLQYGLNKTTPLPEFGYEAKQFDYLDANQINYYSVATPLTELYFKTVMEQGQSADAFITLNTSEQFNFSIAYRGLKSEGKYINQETSTGSFRFTTSYHTKNKRYFVNAHFTGQDFSSEENGGITTPEDFISKNPEYKERITLQVYFENAYSFLKGKRVFIDQNFRINSKEGENNFYISEQFIAENKFFEFNQATVASTVGNVTVNRFGESYVSSNINDQTKYNRMYNKIGANYENKTLGKFLFFIDDFRYNYYYNTVFIFPNQIIPSSLNGTINSVGGQYEYRKEKWDGQFLYTASITDQSLSNLDANLNYSLNAKNKFSFEYQNVNKLPNHIYNLHQSSYIEYNWYNNFKNEKINNIKVTADTQWGSATLMASTLNDYLFFSDDRMNDTVQIVTPKQYDKTINYLSLKLAKEIKFRKFGLDNTFLFQKVDQQNDILNVPQFVTRNTLYYSDYYFSRALYIQTGVTFNYFTKYYANTHNPLIAEFFVQNTTEIGNYANFDFFINARIRQTRIFLMAEHFNSSFANTSTYFSAPNNPYRDFIVRFGLVWNFFQ